MAKGLTLNEVIQESVAELCLIHRGELEELIYEGADKANLLEEYAGAQHALQLIGEQ